MIRKNCSRKPRILDETNSDILMENKRYNPNCPNMNCNNSSDDLFDESCNQYLDQGNMEIPNCNCGFNDPSNSFPMNVMLGQSYVPMQEMPEKIFKPNVGLGMGTIFPELFSPYMPLQSIEENQFLAQTNEIKGGCNR